MRAREHVALTSVCGVVLGLVEAIHGVVEGQTWISSLAGAAAVLVFAAILGLIQAGVIAAARRADRLVGFGPWLAARLTDDREAPRDPVVRFHATIVGTLAALGPTLGGLWLALKRLEPVVNPNLRHLLTLAVVVGLAAVGLVLGALIRRVAIAPLARFDRRFGLPWPRHPLARACLYLAIPPAIAIAPIAIAYGTTLGRLATLLWLVLFFVGELVLLRLWQTLRPPERRAPIAAPTAVLIGAPIMALIAVQLAFAFGATMPRSARFGELALVCLRDATDVDLDGFSSLYGGGDCAAFDPEVSPLAREIPGNGVDEDCDGVDADARAETAALQISSPRAIELAALRPRKLNVVWVIVDAIRADHVSALGYERETTPYLERVAETSLVFHDASAQSSATMLSIPSMLFGRYPGTMTWIERSAKLQPHPSQVSLAERLAEEGYRSAVVLDGYMIGRLGGLRQGYDDTLDIWLDGERQPWHARSGAVATSLAISWLERDRKFAEADRQPFFLTVYASNPHDPYRNHAMGYPKFGKKVTDRYDAEIAFSDRHVGFLIEHLRYREAWDDTIFIFTSDHGEAFGEHDSEKHSTTCYHESVAVPLVVRIPGVEARRVEDRRVALVDVVPTVLDALGLDPGAMELDGQSLLIPAFAPDEQPEDRPIFCSVLSQKAKQGDFFRRSVRAGNFTLATDIAAGTVELYDNAADVEELDDLAGEAEYADTVRSLRAILNASMTGNLAQRRLVD